MKKLIFTLSVVVASLSSYAQFEKGTMMLGGSFGLEFTKDKSKFDGTTVEHQKSTNFHLEPQFGYFVKDQLALGAGLGFNSVDTRKYNSGERRVANRAITIEPFVRYYLPQAIYFQAKFAFGAGNEDRWYRDSNRMGTSESYGVSGVSLAIGYALMLSSNVALEPQAGYYTQANKFNDVKNINSGLYLRAGFQVYLRK